MRTFRRILEGLALVALGLIFLGSTLGFLPWSVSTTVVSLLSLWPVLLITIGLDIIGRGLDAPVLRVISSGIFLVALLYGGLVLPAVEDAPRLFGSFDLGVGGTTSEFDFSKPRLGATEGSIAVKGGAGDITLVAGSGGTLVSATGQSPFKNPFLGVERSGNHAQVVASMGTGSSVWPVSGKSWMKVGISPSVTWDVQVETGAATLEADLEDVRVSGFSLKTGVSDSTITLGRVPAGTRETAVRIESGVSSVKLRIPEGAEARVEAETGLSSVDVPDDFERTSESGRVFESSGYDEGTRHFLIHVQTGLGSVSIERY